MSITTPLKSRITSIFSQIEIVASETGIAAKYLRDTTGQLEKIQHYRDSVEGEYVKILGDAENVEEKLGSLSEQLESLIVGLRDIGQVQHLVGRYFGDLLTRFQVLVGKWEESEEITEDVKSDITNLAILLMNIEVFLNDPDELAALLSTVDPRILNMAIDKVRDNA